MAKVWPQPLLVVRDVPASSRFYCTVLGGESGHGGDEYEQILAEGELVLQLHDFDVEDHHGALAEAGQPLGNGTLVWFEVADPEAAFERVRGTGATIVRGPEVNPNARQVELWFRDPDGYLVVLAGPSPYRPREPSPPRDVRRDIGRPLGRGDERATVRVSSANRRGSSE